MKGRFISVEGTEGVGKSTNLEYICAFLKAHDIDFIQTREPGGTPLAEELRDLLLRHREEAFDPLAELLTVFAARAQHIAQVIRPALERGVWVISDRFTDATYAYQGFGRGLNLEQIEALETLVQGELHPDRVLLLDIDVEEGLSRARERGALDRFEQEQVAFFERVRRGYHARAAEFPDRYRIVDASASLPEVQAQLQKILQSLVGEGSD